jgi:hypothetical protein
MTVEDLAEKQDEQIIPFDENISYYRDAEIYPPLITSILSTVSVTHTTNDVGYGVLAGVVVGVVTSYLSVKLFRWLDRRRYMKNLRE